MCDIVRARGDFDKLDWFRGFDSEDFMVTFNTASEAVQNGWLRMYSNYINENSGALLEFYSEKIAANSKSTILQTLLSFREQSIVRVTVFKGKRVA